MSPQRAGNEIVEARNYYWKSIRSWVLWPSNGHFFSYKAPAFGAVIGAGALVSRVSDYDAAEDPYENCWQ